MALFADEKPKPVALRTGGRLVCQVCSGELFYERQARLDSALPTLFTAELAGPPAVCYVCGQCGYIQWFLDASGGT